MTETFIAVALAACLMLLMLKTPKARHDACSCDGLYDHGCGAGRDSDSSGGDAG